MTCSLCLEGREDFIKTWPEKHLPGLKFLKELGNLCEKHDKEATAKLVGFKETKTYTLSTGPKIKLPPIVDEPPSRYEREVGEEG